MFTGLVMTRSSDSRQSRDSSGIRRRRRMSEVQISLHDLCKEIERSDLRVVKRDMNPHEPFDRRKLGRQRHERLKKNAPPSLLISGGCGGRDCARAGNRRARGVPSAANPAPKCSKNSAPSTKWPICVTPPCISDFRMSMNLWMPFTR